MLIPTTNLIYICWYKLKASTVLTLNDFYCLNRRVHLKVIQILTTDTTNKGLNIEHLIKIISVTTLLLLYPVHAAKCNSALLKRKFVQLKWWMFWAYFQIQISTCFQLKEIFMYNLHGLAKTWCPSSEQTGLTLETSAKHHIPQATNIPYQPCWSNPYLAYSPTQKNSFFQN